VETNWPPPFRFLSSYQCELNPVPIRINSGEETSFDFSGENKPFLNFCIADAFFLAVQMFCLSKRPDFSFVLLSDQRGTYMFYLCIKGISAGAGSASEVLHYLFAGFCLPRTTFSTAR